METLRYVTIPSANYELGWRFTEAMPAEALVELSRLIPLDAMVARFAPHRTVTLPAFSIAATTVSFESVMGDPYDLDELTTLSALCASIDARLAERGLRLPTEDELEAAAGGSLFAWGMEIPDGIPYGEQTSFTDHHEPNAFGLTMNADPYQVEIARTALKLGDGGATICGGDPWPLAWLTLSPSYRLLEDMYEDCFTETLECARIRPVRL